MFFGRSDRIRTCDLCNPIATRYQAAPRSDSTFRVPGRLASPPRTRRILARSRANGKPLLHFFFNCLARPASEVRPALLYHGSVATSAPYPPRKRLPGNKELGMYGQAERGLLKGMNPRITLVTVVVVAISLIYGAFYTERLAHGLAARSEEHTSELQSRPHLVCRLLLEKKKDKERAS